MHSWLCGVRLKNNMASCRVHLSFMHRVSLFACPNFERLGIGLHTRHSLISSVCVCIVRWFTSYANSCRFSATETFLKDGSIFNFFLIFERLYSTERKFYETSSLIQLRFNTLHWNISLNCKHNHSACKECKVSIALHPLTAERYTQYSLWNSKWQNVFGTRIGIEIQCVSNILSGKYWTK